MVVLSNFLAPQEGIRHEEQNTTVYVNDREVGKGTLYITERYVQCKIVKYCKNLVKTLTAHLEFIVLLLQRTVMDQQYDTAGLFHGVPTYIATRNL